MLSVHFKWIKKCLNHNELPKVLFKWGNFNFKIKFHWKGRIKVGSRGRWGCRKKINVIKRRINENKGILKIPKSACAK